MKNIILVFYLVLLVGCIEPSSEIRVYEKVEMMNGVTVIPYDNNFLQVDEDTGKLVFVLVDKKDCKIYKGYLNVCQKDSTGSRYGYFYNFLLSDNKNFFKFTSYEDKPSNVSLLKKGDKVYTVWSDKMRENIKILK